MIYAYVVLPVAGSLLLLLSFFVGAAASPGFRQVLLGLRGKGKASLFNVLSIEGAGVVLIIAIIAGFGIYYPLTTVPTLLAKEQEMREANARWPIVWQIEGSLRLPQDWKPVGSETTDYFTTIAGARVFWGQGKWSILPPERHSTQFELIPNPTDFRRARIKIEIAIPANTNPAEWLGAIQYEDIRHDLRAILMFDKFSRKHFTLEPTTRKIKYEQLELAPGE